jgi:hypothetical protein
VKALRPDPSVGPLPFGRGSEADPRATEPGPIQRVEASWGAMWVVAPGIGVEDPGGTNEAFARFIYETLGQIRATRLGSAMLAQFDPKSGSGYRTISDDPTSPYRGLTVLVGEPSAQNQLIKTIDVGPLLSAEGNRTNSGTPKVPRISFFNRPAGEQRRPIGASGAEVVSGGIVGHRDFPHDTQTFDVVLYHELGHAFLSQTGVTKHLDDGQEEQIVVGRLGAKGLGTSENAYRCERGLGLRKSYLDVGVQADEAMAKSFWESQRIGLVKALMGVLHISEEEAAAKLRG